MFKALVLIACASSFVAAQQAAWGQCGGQGWTGATTCVSGYTCKATNEWYSQCVPGTGPVPSSTTTTVPPPSPTGSTQANYWFSFGDSYTQTGFSPSGALPNAANPFGNPTYPGWTATGGPNWIDFMTVSQNRSLVFTYNYAYGGATIDAALVKPYTPTVLSLGDQVNQFLTTVANKPASTPWTSANALFSIWIGVNDLGNSWYEAGDRAAFSDVLLNAQFALVEKLYNVDARNFLFLNVPPTDRSPLLLGQDAYAQATLKAVINTHNSKLNAKIAAFKSSHTGVSTWTWDAHATFTKFLNSPSTYGFTSATAQGGTKDFWVDTLHTTSYANQLFAESIRKDALGNSRW